MGTPYTGPTTMPTRGALTITEPVDGDDDNAATFDVPFRQLTDRVSQLSAHAAIVDDPNTFTETNQFDGVSNFENTVNLNTTVNLARAVNDALPLLSVTNAPTNRRAFVEMPGGAGRHARLYFLAGGWELVENAKFNTNTSQWDQEDAGYGSSRLYTTPGGPGGVCFVFQFKAQGSGSWGEGAWDDLLVIDGSGNVEIAGNLDLPNGNIVLGAGSVDAPGGFIGDLQGNVDATVVEAQQVVGAGAAPSAAPGAGMGTGRSVTLGAGSTDSYGLITLTTGTGPLSGGAQNAVAVTFNQTRGSAARVQLTAASKETAQELYGVNAVWAVGSTSGFTIESNAGAMASAFQPSRSYSWYYSVGS